MLLHWYSKGCWGTLQSNLGLVLLSHSGQRWSHFCSVCFFFWLKIFGNSRISCFSVCFLERFLFFVTFCDSGWLWKIILQPLAFLKRNTLQFKMLAMKVCFLKNCDFLSRETHSGNGWLTGRRWCLGEFGPIELEERGGDLRLPMKFSKLPWVFTSNHRWLVVTNNTRHQGKDEADLGRDCFSGSRGGGFLKPKTDISPDFKGGWDLVSRRKDDIFSRCWAVFFFPPDIFFRKVFCRGAAAGCFDCAWCYGLGLHLAKEGLWVSFTATWMHRGMFDPNGRELLSKDDVVLLWKCFFCCTAFL